MLGAFAVFCGVTRKPAEAELDLIGKASRLAAIAIEQRQLTDKLAHQAQHDALTGLPNRVLFEDRLQQALAQGAGAGLAGGRAVRRIWTASSRSTTPSAIRGRRCCCNRSPGGWRAASARPTRWRAWEATSSRSLLTELRDHQYCAHGGAEAARRAQGPILGGRLRAVRDRQHRHQRLSAGRKRRRHPAAQRRQRHVPRQESGPEQLPGLPARDQRHGPGVAGDRERAAAGLWRTTSSNCATSRRWTSTAAGGPGGAAGLEPPQAGDHPAGAIHPGGRGVRADRFHRRLGAAAGLPAARRVAARGVRTAGQGGGERLRHAVHAPGLCRGRGPGAQGDRPGPSLPGAGDSPRAWSCGTFRNPPGRWSGCARSA